MREQVARAKRWLAIAAIKTLEFQFRQWALDKLYLYAFPRTSDERLPAADQHFRYLDISGDDRHGR